MTLKINASSKLRSIAKKVLDNALPIDKDQVAVFYADPPANRDT